MSEKPFFHKELTKTRLRRKRRMVSPGRTTSTNRVKARFGLLLKGRNSFLISTLKWQWPSCDLEAAMRYLQSSYSSMCAPSKVA